MTQTIQLGSYGLVLSRSICNMMSISYRRLENTNRLWKLACLALVWVVWWERNARIFENRVRSSKGLWDMIFFIASSQASCSTTFKGVPFNLIQLDWVLVGNSKGVGQLQTLYFVLLAHVLLRVHLILHNNFLITHWAPPQAHFGSLGPFRCTWPIRYTPISTFFYHLNTSLV